MAENKHKIGWVGVGRMGYPMAERLIKAGYDVAIWNRTRAKAEPLAKLGAKVVGNLADLKGVDVLFSIVSTGKDLEQVYFGSNGVVGQGGKLPKFFVDCSTDSLTILPCLGPLLSDQKSKPLTSPCVNHSER